MALGPIALLENFVKHTHALSAPQNIERWRSSSACHSTSSELGFQRSDASLQIAFEKSFSTSIELCELTGSLDECTRDDLTSINYHMRRLAARV